MSSSISFLLCNNSSHPLSRDALAGSFSTTPPETIGSGKSCSFSLSVPEATGAQVEEHCSCSYSNPDGTFTFEWKSNSLDGFLSTVPETYVVESGISDGVFSITLKQENKDAGLSNGKVENQPETTESTTQSSKDETEADRASSSSSSSSSSNGSNLSLHFSSANNSPVPRRASFDRTSTTSLTSFGDLADIYHRGDKAIERRDYIVMEILKSERTYVENLTTLLCTYMVALKQIPESTLPSSLVMSIFSNAEEILPVNKQLLVELEKKWENWSPVQTIGDTIFKMTPFLKTYKNYTARYSEALTALRECEKNVKFQSITYKCTIICRFDLDALLIQPVQRIPRYNLLLADLLKNTDEAHPDFRNLEKSIEEMKNIAQYINESIQMNENRKKVIDIHNSLVSLPPDLNLVEPHRIFVLQSVLTKVCRKQPKKFTFFLFSDVLLYADQSLGDRYRVHHVFYLSKCRFIDKGLANTFDIVSEKKSFAVVTKDSEEKDAWLSKLDHQVRQIRTRRASLQALPGTYFMDKLNEAKGEAPVWVPDDAAKTCNKCSDTFTLISRRHHCRVCGLLVCGKCSPKKMRIPTLDNKNVRVCNSCYESQKLQQIVETQEA